MKLYVLFGQPFQDDYKGKSVLEALAVIDEFVHNECDVWIHERYHEHYATGDFQSMRIVEIEIDRDDLNTIFQPPPIQGDIGDPVSDLVMTCKTIMAGISNREKNGSVLSIEEEYIRFHLTEAVKKIQDLTN